VIAVLTVLVAFPAGFLLRSHLAANTLYAVVYLWAFVFQTLYLQLGGEGEDPAFHRGEFPIAYGLVTSTVFAVGFGLVAAGRWVRQRRASGASAAASVAPAE